MIFGRHEIGGVTFRPPTTTEGYGTHVLMVEQADSVELHDEDANTREVKLVDGLDRGDVERLRDLCDEALR